MGTRALLLCLLSVGEPAATDAAADEPAPSEQPAPAPAQPAPAPADQPVPTDPFADGGVSGGHSQPRPEPGGFGSVESVTTTSNVSQPLAPEPESEPSSRLELSARLELGYGQANLRNVEGLDHQGMAFRANFAFFPWFDKAHRVGFGLGLGYGYQGLNRKLGAGSSLQRSKGRQQQIHLSIDTIVRPHPQMFSMHLSGLLGVGFYSFDDAEALLIADRPARVPSNERALTTGGALALCSLWDILCVVGGADYILDVYTVPVEPDSFTARVSPWGWRIGLGFDVMRVFARSNRVD